MKFAGPELRSPAAHCARRSPKASRTCRLSRPSLPSGSLAAPAALALLALLLIAAPALAQEAPGTWYAVRVISGDTPPVVEHLWSKGSKLRAETVIGGRPVVTLVSGERYMTIDTLSNTGVSIQRSPRAIGEDGRRGRPFGNEASILESAGGEKVSVEQVGGSECDLYRLTNSEGRQEVCVSRDEARLPLLLRVWRRTSGKEAVTRYLDWIPGLALSDDFFQPDPRAALEPLTYDDYVRRAGGEEIGPAPPLFRELLHGTR